MILITIGFKFSSNYRDESSYFVLFRVISCVSRNSWIALLLPKKRSTNYTNTRNNTNYLVALAADVRVPVSHPVVDLVAHYVPIDLHFVYWFIHPGRQLRTVQIVAHRNAIILLCRLSQTLRCVHKLVK